MTCRTSADDILRCGAQPNTNVLGLVPEGSDLLTEVGKRVRLCGEILG